MINDGSIPAILMKLIWLSFNLISFKLLTSAIEIQWIDEIRLINENAGNAAVNQNLIAAQFAFVDCWSLIQFNSARQNVLELNSVIELTKLAEWNGFNLGLS